MRHTTQHVLGHAAYLRRSCELLLDQLRDIDRLTIDTKQLTPLQEAAISQATTGHAECAKDHLELASQYIDKWREAVAEGLNWGAS
jgi:hypothetical protein